MTPEEHLNAKDEAYRTYIARHGSDPQLDTIGWYMFEGWCGCYEALTAMNRMRLRPIQAQIEIALRSVAAITGEDLHDPRAA